METNFLLIRHGNIEMGERIPGRIPGMHLSAMGRKQAERIAENLNAVAVSAIYASPLDRTIETAAPLAKRKGLEISTRENLQEIDFGNWTGKGFDELESDENWKQFHFFRNGCLIPNGELMVQVQERMVREIFAIQALHKGETVALFSHNDPIKSVLAFFLGVSLDVFLRIKVDTGSISVLTLGSDTSMVKCINFTDGVNLQV